MTDGSNYKFTEPSIPNRGYIFCPEYTSSDPFKISDNGAATTTILFGATTMPDLAVGVERSPSPIEPKTPPAVVADKDSSSVASSDNETMAHEGTIKPIPRPLENSTTVQIADEKVAETKAVLIRFGVDKSSNEPVEWSVSSSANPHLMIVGFPGMGKTEAVLNICQQLKAQSITPIVFSYHPDIETDFRSNEATRKVPRAVLSRRFPKSSSCQTRSSELRLITTVSDKATRCNHEKWANFDTN